MYSLGRRLTAEAFGTFWLVFCGCGSAVIAAQFPGVGIGLLGVSLAFGLTVLTVAYAMGHVSGGHLNPAVTVGMVTAGRFPAGELLPYVAAQLAGAVVASGLLYFIASSSPGFDPAAGIASNGVGARSPGLYTATAGFVTELVMSFAFMTVILGAVGKNAPRGFAPLAIGLCLTLIHLVSIPVTNTSVNPARSTGPAIFDGAAALGQLWIFWVAPILGSAASGLASRAWHASEGAARHKPSEEVLTRAA
jgi:aquaporin Z